MIVLQNCSVEDYYFVYDEMFYLSLSRNCLDVCAIPGEEVSRDNVSPLS